MVRDKLDAAADLVDQLWERYSGDGSIPPAQRWLLDGSSEDALTYGREIVGDVIRLRVAVNGGGTQEEADLQAAVEFVPEKAN